MTIRIYHNPACGSSRRTLALIREAGIEPEIVEYLKTPLDAPGLRALLDRLGLDARGLLRSKQKECAALGLDDPGVPEDRLVAAMAAHPILMERPVVVTPTGAAICRPPERVLDLLGS